MYALMFAGGRTAMVVNEIKNTALHTPPAGVMRTDDDDDDERMGNEFLCRAMLFWRFPKLSLILLKTHVENKKQRRCVLEKA